MIKAVPFSAVTVLLACTVSGPAAADFYIQMSDGRYLIIPGGFLMLCGLAALVTTVIFVISQSDTAKQAGDEISFEISTPESSDYYDDQAARARALKRKLDAEVDLAKSYIDAARTKAELDELTEILDLDKAKRRAKR